VRWDSDDPLTDSFLWAAIELARLMCLQQRHDRDSQIADFDGIGKSIHDIEKHAANLDEVRKYAETIQTASGKILKRVEVDSEAFKKQIDLLRIKVDDLKVCMTAPQ
jgi:hypothetical protein